MKLKFIVDINSDVWNWHECATKSGSYGQDWRKNWPKDFLLKYGKDKEKIKAYLNKKYYKNKLIQKYVEWIQLAIDPKIINEILKEITGKNIPFKEVYVKITTYARCPYDSEGGGFYSCYAATPKWFYQVAIHECMHLIVHKYYWKQMLGFGLSDTQAHDIKEALTVLLNPIFQERWNSTEEGYPNHQDLRKDIEKINLETKTFNELMVKTIKLYIDKYMKKVA